jgi:arylsulfatase A-like enzyme
MIVRLPQGQGEQNVERESVVGWEDIMPTLLDLAGCPTPDKVEGQSMLPLMQRSNVVGRSFYHHEHAPCYHPENCYQSLTDPEWKYIWNPVTGADQLFHLETDPYEQIELSSDPAHDTTLQTWRTRMAEHLADRPEPWSDGRTLTPGPYPVVRGQNSTGFTEEVK